MKKLEISQILIWAIIHQNPSKSFYAITAESKKKQTCDGQTAKVWILQKVIIFKSQLKYLPIIVY